MRGIGKGQKIHCMIIPEIGQLMAREFAAARKRDTNLSGVKFLRQVSSRGIEGTVAKQTIKDALPETFDIARMQVEDPAAVLREIVAWLVVNSMRSEQIQWSMLCIQNCSNIFRKTAFEVMLRAGTADPIASMQSPLDVSSEDPVNQLSAGASIEVFTETIDFSLDSAVPDPAPFETKLRTMLEDHAEFIPDVAAHERGHAILNEVGRCSAIEGSANKLESEQEREQEQEQQKEVKARRDQQVEIEKFVDREYSRNQEEPNPWPLSALLQPPPAADVDEDADDKCATDSPFYRLSNFKLRHQESLCVPDQLFLSRNYFNPQWSGLRRLKNVIMVLEWAPEVPVADTTDDASVGLRLQTAEEHVAASPPLTPDRADALKKAFMLLCGGREEGLSRRDLTNAVQAVTDMLPSEKQVDTAALAAGATAEGYVSFAGFTELLKTRHLLPTHNERYYVGISLAEAETIRRVLHIRGTLPLVSRAGGDATAEVALRYSPLASPGSMPLGDGGVAFDTSAGWRRRQASVATQQVAKIDCTGATTAEGVIAHGVFRFFDGDMHYSDQQLNSIIRSLQASSTFERERFFASTVGVRRRMDRRWQETPLAKVFSMSDEYSALKLRAQAVFVRETLAERGMKKWEAFMAFDRCVVEAGS
jgi:hypothetical protein